MEINNFLNSVCKQIKYEPIRNEIAEELKTHIEEIKQAYQEKGLNEQQAEQKAITQMGNPEEIGIKLNKIHKPKLDWKLLIIMIITLGFSTLVAITKSTSQINKEILSKYFLVITIGGILSIIFYFFDYKKILKHSNKIFIIGTLILIYSLLSRAAINGMSCIRLGKHIISSSAIAMPLYIIAFVGFLENIHKTSKLKIKYLEKDINMNIIKIIACSIFSIYLLLAIPSVVSAFILGLTYLTLATIKILEEKKNCKKYISLLWGIPTILIIIFTTTIILNFSGIFRINRIIASFNPESDPFGAGWIGINQKQVIKTAKLFGEAENTSNALPIFDQGTNFAFISLLAHYGWIVSLSLIITLILLNIKLIINAIKIKEIYGKNITIGIATMFILQSICNLLMNVNLGIQADFNIPFISYGNINLIINMICIALVFSVYRRKDITYKNI